MIELQNSDDDHGERDDEIARRMRKLFPPRSERPAPAANPAATYRPRSAAQAPNLAATRASLIASELGVTGAIGRRIVDPLRVDLLARDSIRGPAGRRSTHNGRAAIAETYGEILDAVLALSQAILEASERGVATAPLFAVLDALGHAALALRPAASNDMRRHGASDGCES